MNQLQLVNELTSPLFRIMSLYDIDNPSKVKYLNNICAFHIGSGLIVSVAHNIRSNAQLFESIEDSLYVTKILPKLTPQQTLFFDQFYPLDVSTAKRYRNVYTPNDNLTMINILKSINFNTRWLDFINEGICKNFLIIESKEEKFFGSKLLNKYFNKNTLIQEPVSNRYIYILEVELVEAFYSDDIALYKIVNFKPEVINKIPSLEVDFSILENQSDIFCLQSAPSAYMGRLLNVAKIEGYLDQYSTFQDEYAGNYIMEGLRYLIKGYFRFGSSGAPYVWYDNKVKKYKVNAVQSEACPIQLSINNNRDGNFQYINAIASPLRNVEVKLKEYIEKSNKVAFK